MWHPTSGISSGAPTTGVSSIASSLAKLDKLCFDKLCFEIMEIRFIGRRNELKLLEQAFDGEESSFIPIYGRRRVGKSELILRFLKDKPGIYSLGKKAPAGLQISEFLREAALALDEPLLASMSAASWSDALAAVVSRWRGRSKLVLAFDEFQWMVESSPELPSVLQEMWDRRWKRDGNVVLIVCGSYIGFMEREILGRKSPLYGRRTAQILLRPFSYREASEFHPGYSIVDRAKTYFLCGGVPLYLQFFSDRSSVDTNIREQLLSEHAPLFREADFLLREELREVENYHAVLTAIAAGSATNREISRQAGIDERKLHYYTQQLIELGYLRRRYPLIGGRKVRRVRYDLDEPILRFWFRFVFPNMSYIMQMGSVRAFNNRIRPQLDAYFGHCFERLCRKALPVLYQREGVTAAFEVGEYWDKTAQIDVVGRRDDGWVDLCECKWGTVRSAPAVERELAAKRTAYPNPENATIGPRVFCRNLPRTRTGQEDAARWHDLESLYE